MNFSKENLETAKQQMQGMSSEQMAQQFKNMGPAEMAQMQAMGLNTEQIKNMQKMMAENPAMLDQARKNMENMNPEQMEAARSKMQANAATLPGGTSTPAVSAGGGIPLNSTVELYGLSKAEFNGKRGTIRGTPNGAGRQEVKLAETGKVLALKAANIRVVDPNYSGDPDQLTVKQMKRLLVEVGEGGSAAGVAEISELRRLVAEHVPTDKIPALLAATAAPAPAPASSGSGFGVANMDADQLKKAGEQLHNMDPSQMRAQAAQLRAMPPDQVRRSNPQMAHMTDGQIREAAGQMEAMADNPAMMKMAAEQMGNMSPEQVAAQMDMVKNLSPEELDQAKSMFSGMGGGGGGGGGAGAGTGGGGGGGGEGKEGGGEVGERGMGGGVGGKGCFMLNGCSQIES